VPAPIIARVSVDGSSGLYGRFSATTTVSKLDSPPARWETPSASINAVMAMSEMSMAVHPVAPAKPYPGSVIYN
jgi:hypothetical protein